MRDGTGRERQVLRVRAVNEGTGERLQIRKVRVFGTGPVGEASIAPIAHSLAARDGAGETHLLAQKRTSGR